MVLDNIKNFQDCKNYIQFAIDYIYHIEIWSLPLVTAASVR